LDRVIDGVLLGTRPLQRLRSRFLRGRFKFCVLVRRIARGSGTSVHAVSQLVKQFAQMKKVMKQVARGKMPSLQQLAGGR